jgi:hypothetical protein
MIEQFSESAIDRLLKEYPPKVLSPEERVRARALREQRNRDERAQKVGEGIQRIWQRNVPERYRNVDLSTLEPNDVSHMPLDKQRAIIKKLRAAPLSGYCFCAPSGWSKSTFMCALYREALNACGSEIILNTGAWIGNYHPVVMMDAITLMDMIQDWKLGKIESPLITAEKIEILKQRYGFTTHLFLDEFEKVKKSVFRMGEMYNLINAMYKHGGQLVIAGNMTKADLDDKSQYLEGTFRRIEDLTTPHFWEFGQPQE